MKRLLAALALLAFSGLALAQQQPVNCATSTPCSNGGPVNTGTGDQPPIAFSKLNANDKQLYGMFGTGSSLQTTGKASAADIIGLWGGTCSTSTYLNGAGVCETPPQGTVTSVGIAPAGTYAAAISVSGSPVTSSGTIDITPNLFSSSAAGVVPSSGGGTSNYLRADGTWAAPPGTTGCSFEGPQTSVGLTAVTGSTGKCMDAGSAPALDQSISPTMTGAWTFTPSVNSGILITRGSVPTSLSSLTIKDGTSGNALDQYLDLTNGTDADISLKVTEVGASVKYGLISPAVAVPLYLGNSSGVKIYDSAGNGPYQVGYLGTPENTQSVSYTITAADRGKTIMETASGTTISVPCASFSPGDTFTVLYDSTSGSITIGASSGTIFWANGSGNTTGNRTLTGAALATIVIDGGDNCIITGSGIS